MKTRPRKDKDGEKCVLRVRDLCVARGKVRILNGVDWAVRRGEHWVLLGPNGCGKTSLLKVLTGFLSSTSGAIELMDHVYGRCDWRELRRRIGWVASALQASIPPAETVLDTVMSGRYAQLDLWARTTTADARAARRWLRWAGLRAQEQREWQYLSQGERQRVLIARALMARPRMLILDEPCAGLDPVARASFLAFLRELARHSRAPTLVLVTHHVEEIGPEFTHALLLRGGKALAQGPLARTLTTSLVSEAFGHPIRVSRRGGAWRATLLPSEARR